MKLMILAGDDFLNISVCSIWFFKNTPITTREMSFFWPLDLHRLRYMESK